MTCQRCKGLMVQERFDDVGLGSAGYEVSAWRCLNCGAIVDAVIEAHHHTIRQNRAGSFEPAEAQATGDGDITDSSPFTAARADTARHAQHHSFKEVHP